MRLIFRNAEINRPIINERSINLPQTFLYTFDATLVPDVQLSRWKLLGNILRSPENNPAQSALRFVVDHVTVTCD